MAFGGCYHCFSDSITVSPVLFLHFIFRCELRLGKDWGNRCGKLQDEEKEPVIIGDHLWDTAPA